MKFAVSKFGGSYPRMEEHLLGESQAAYALDARFLHGSINTWREPLLVKSLDSSSIASVDCCWLDYQTCVDVAQGSVLCQHIFLTGRSDYPERGVISVEGGECSVVYSRLGLPCPTVAPTVAYGASGAVKDNMAYSYAYQYENAFGERSALSPGSPVTMQTDGSSNTVSGWTVPAASWGVTKVRIFRTVTASDAQAAKLTPSNALDTTWMLVGEAAIGGTFVDSSWADELAEAAEEDVVLPPPDNLQGITWVESKNILIGFVGRRVYFTQNYQYHNWSLFFDLDDNVRAICESGDVYILTDGSPYVFRETTPVKLPKRMPMAAYGNRHVAPLAGGVVYPTHDGMAALSGNSTPALITQALYAPDDWQRLRPDTVIPAVHQDKLFVFARGGSFVMDVNPSTGWQLDTHSELSDTDVQQAVVMRSGALALLKADGIYLWNMGSAMRPYQWHSPLLRASKPVAFAAVQVKEAQGFADVQVFSDNHMVFNETFLASGTDLLPMWAAGSDWQLRIRGTARLTYVAIASSMRDF